MRTRKPAITRPRWPTWTILKYLAHWESKPPEGEVERAADWALALEGRVKVKQGRVGEGESDVRRALLSRLSKSGKYHVDTAGVLSVFVYVMQEQGRYQEAEQLQRQVIDIYPGLGYPRNPASWSMPSCSWRSSSISSGATTRRPSCTTRSTSGPPSGSRSGAKRSVADCRGFRTCSARAMPPMRSRSRNARSSASVPARATTASIRRSRAATTRLRSPAVRSRRRRCRPSRNRFRYC